MAVRNLLQESDSPYSPRSTGERFIQAHACSYPPSVEACDIVRVDFDCHSVQYASLYLVEEVKDGEVVWMGCRRFDVQPSGIKVDADGEGDWQPFTGYAAQHWRIAGEVKEVFKPASRLLRNSNNF